MTVDFDDLEEVMGRELPASASVHAPWWANSRTNPQSRDWVARGWRAHHPRPLMRTVGFRKVAPSATSLIPDEPSGRNLDEASLAPGEPPIDAQGRPSEIVAALLEYAIRSQSRPQGTTKRYTPIPEANALVFEDPFAFLVAVIFDQGITAERAWNAPYLLQQRLGYFEPKLIAANEDAVRSAIQQPPMLHRFKENMSHWVTSAARQVIDRYGGDASRIWSDSPTANELQRRLVAFDGIGQKKAAMAVELLERDLGIEVREMQGSDIAYDVHIRRVMLRTGLADHDDVTSMVEQARRLNPDRPGSLDHPMWDIGRRWCRPQNPDCGSCPLGNCCPRLINEAGHIKGVG